MNNQIKNPFALQKGTVATLCLVCTLFFMTAGCGMNDNVKEKKVEVDELYTYLSGEKIPVQKIDGKFYIEFYSVNENKIKEACAQKSVVLEDVQPIRDWASFTAAGTEGAGAKIFTDLMFGFMEGSYEQCTDVFSFTLYWSPFYKFGVDDFDVKVSSKFTVILNSETTLKQIERLAEENSVEMIGVDRYESNWYHLACTNQSKGNALEMANLFYESGLFSNAYPNCMAGWLD